MFGTADALELRGTMPISPVTITKIILVMLLWAACYPLITAGLQYSPHLTFAALRAAIAGAFLTILALCLRRPLPRGWRNWATLSVIGLGATSLGFLGMFHAAEFVTPGLATVIANTQPLLAAVLSIVWLRERFSVAGWAGLALGFAGILVIASPQFSGDSNDYLLGVAYIVMAALGVTVSNVAIKSIAGKVDVLSAMGCQLLLGSIPLTFAAFLGENPTAIDWTPTFAISLFSLALLGSALVYWLWFSVLQTVPLNRANVFSFLIPVFGLTMGVVFFDERLSGFQMTGIVLIVVGIVLVNLQGKGSAGAP